MLISLEQEKDRLDFITESMNSQDFLENITVSIFNDKVNSISIKNFYDAWLESFHDGKLRIPASLGSVVGYMYCGILLAKENWFDLLPDISIKDASEEFGFAGIEYSYPLNENPKLSQVVRRMRNALGHGNIDVFISDNMEFKNRFDESFFIFKDQNQRNPADTFEIKLPFSRVFMFVRKFQSIIFEHVNQKEDDSVE